MRFRGHVEAHAPTHPKLPLFHITDEFSADQILDVGRLQPSACRFFGNRRILYSFYGRPAFRSKALNEPTRLESMRPVCFVIDAEKSPTPTRVYPFDTGAFESERYSDAMNPKMKRDDFQLTASVDSAAKVVTAFFDGNRRYFENKIRAGLVHPKGNYHVESYIALISSQLSSPVDERASTAEIQFESPIGLNEACIGIVAPSEFLDGSKISEKYPAIVPMPYSYVARAAGSWSGSFYTKISAFLEEARLI